MLNDQKRNPYAGQKGHHRNDGVEQPVAGGRRSGDGCRGDVCRRDVELRLGDWRRGQIRYLGRLRQHGLRHPDLHLDGLRHATGRDWRRSGRRWGFRRPRNQHGVLARTLRMGGRRRSGERARGIRPSRRGCRVAISECRHAITGGPLGCRGSRWGRAEELREFTGRLGFGGPRPLRLRATPYQGRLKHTGELARAFRFGGRRCRRRWHRGCGHGRERACQLAWIRRLFDNRDRCRRFRRR